MEYLRVGGVPKERGGGVVEYLPPPPPAIINTLVGVIVPFRKTPEKPPPEPEQLMNPIPPPPYEGDCAPDDPTTMVKFKKLGSLNDAETEPPKPPLSLLNGVTNSN